MTYRVALSPLYRAMMNSLSFAFLRPVFLKLIAQIANGLAIIGKGEGEPEFHLEVVVLISDRVIADDIDVAVIVWNGERNDSDVKPPLHNLQILLENLLVYFGHSDFLKVYRILP